jgi:outer membrane protein
MKSLCILAAAASVSGASPALAQEGNVLVRARAILVSPTERAGPVQPSFPAASVSVTDSWAPGVDVTYFLNDTSGWS